VLSISDMKSSSTWARISYPPSMSWCLNFVRGCNHEWCTCLCQINSTVQRPLSLKMQYEIWTHN
jgi:hypothetical protein